MHGYCITLDMRRIISSIHSQTPRLETANIYSTKRWQPWTPIFRQKTTGNMTSIDSDKQLFCSHKGYVTTYVKPSTGSERDPVLVISAAQRETQIMLTTSFHTVSHDTYNCNIRSRCWRWFRRSPWRCRRIIPPIMSRLKRTFERPHTTRILERLTYWRTIALEEVMYLIDYSTWRTIEREGLSHWKDYRTWRTIALEGL